MRRRVRGCPSSPLRLRETGAGCGGGEAGKRAERVVENVKKQTGWVVCTICDQTWVYLHRPVSDYITTEPKEAWVLRATGREAAAAKASAILGHPVGFGRGINPYVLGDGLGAPFHEDKPGPEDTEEWIEFVRDVRAFRKGDATW